MDTDTQRHGGCEPLTGSRTLRGSFVLGVWRMQTRQCTACGQPFRPRPQVPQQRYCAAQACQRQRRRGWQRAKLRTDPDYRDNQARAQRAWGERHPEYWREYRARQPQYVERNRVQQQHRDRKRRRAGRRRAEPVLAKRDASTPVGPVPAGTYRLTPVTQDRARLAKRDAWTVQIAVLSAPCA